MKVLALSDLVAGATGLILPLSADAGTDVVVRSVVIHESGRRVDDERAIVLVTSRVEDRYSLAALVEEIGVAAAIVLPHQAAQDASLVESATSVRLYRRSKWAEWAEVFQVLTRLLEAGDLVQPAPRVDTLDALAQWISVQSGTSVTIEDLHSRVVTYAVSGDAIDPIRTRTILDREVPAWRVQRLMASGFLPAVWRSDDVVVRDADEEDPARMVIALKKGSETLGTMWAMLEEDTDREGLRQLMLAVRDTASTLLLRTTLQAQYERHLQEAALADLVSGVMTPGLSASQFGWEAGARYVVAALGVDDVGPRALAFHLCALRAGAVTVPTHSGLFVVIPVREGEASEKEVAQDLQHQLRRVDRSGKSALVGLGRAVMSFADVGTSADEASSILEAVKLGARLPDRSTSNGPTLLLADDVAASIALVRVAQILAPAASSISAPLHVLEDHDRRHRTPYVETITAVLNHPGNLSDAARALGIHLNTLRYRLDRITTAVGLDPRSADARLLLSLALLLRGTEAAR